MGNDGNGGGNDGNGGGNNGNGGGNNGNGSNGQQVDVCHVDDNGIFNLINVNVNALPAHRGHGDALPGEPVPGSTALVFNESCGQVGIDIEKSTNGEDADPPPGSDIVEGSSVAWSYVVSNTGNVQLTGVVVSDDQGVAVSCPQTTLAAGATMTCTGNGVASIGPYANVGVATGTSSGTDVNDTDPSHYNGVPEDPSISIEKSTRDSNNVYQDADTGTGPALPAGSAVSWRYEVMNTGNVALTGITVTDNMGVGVDCGGQTTLAADAAMTCTGEDEAILGQYENLGTVTATAPSGVEVTASDPSRYLGTRSGVQIEKATNGQDADSPPGPEIPVGAGIDWTYVVTNTGGTELTNIQVTDGLAGVTVSCPQTSLVGGDSMTCTASGVAVVGSNQAAGSVVANVATTTDTVSDSDPSNYLGVDAATQNPAISIEKLTNGFDADLATDADVPTLSVGAIVTWTYRVTNAGDTPLFPVVVTDDKVAPLDCGLDLDGPLLPGQAATCTATGAVVEGDYENTGTATGTPSDAQGNPTGAANVVATDLSHYTGVAAASDSIAIEKSTQDQNGTYQDADAAPGPTLSVGDPVTWSYVVTNTGSSSLGAVAVTDDQGVVVTCPVNFLSPGDSTNCVGTGVVVAGQYTNVGTVSALAAGGATVSDSDTSNYFGEAPRVSIDIEKSTNGIDADAAPGPTLTAGAAVTWSYVVTNDGGVDLTNVTVTDNDDSVVLSCPGGIPDPFVAGTSFACDASGTATVGQYQNLGTATGLDAASGQTVSDTDRSHYFVDLPASAAIQLEKSTNGADADSSTDPDVPQIPEGQPVTWLYEVTNTGGVNLTNVVVTDDNLGTVCALTLSGESLAPNDTASCTATGVATVGPYENTGTVTADAGTAMVTDTDLSHYVGLGPVTIDIEKATNLQDADTAPVMLTVGDPVTWSYVVTNTSAENLINITVTDDLGGPVSCPQTTLAPAESMTCSDKTAANGAVLGQYRNVASATGDALDGRVAFDSDPSRYVGTPSAGGAAISLEKFTNGADTGASGPGPTLTVGTTATWTYVVTNIGTVSLGGTAGIGAAITVSDDKEGTVACPFVTILAPLQSMTCTASGDVVEGPYTNQATVTARPVSGNGQPTGDPAVTATDDSHYVGQAEDNGR